MQDDKIKAYVRCPKCGKVAFRLTSETKGITAAQVKCKSCAYQFDFKIKLRRAYKIA